MSKSKIDFITDLLASKKLAPTLKERFFTLAIAEIKKIGVEDEKIWKELGSLKRKLETGLKVKQNEGVIEKKTVEKISHNPKKTSEYLKLFKTGNKLKWITHIYPNTEISSFNYERITQEAIVEFKQISKHLPVKVRTFISLFLQQFKTNPDRNRFYYLGDAYETWWSEKIVDWCKSNPGLHPDTDEFLSRTIITPFKKGIEIRDGQDLKNAIIHLMRKNYGETIFSQIQIDYSGIKRGTRFFTGVDQLMTGISSLFAPIIKRKNISNKIQISTAIEEYNNQFVSILEIVHLESDADVDLDSNTFLSGDLLAAKNEFSSICDWQISANFGNGTFGFSPLDSFGGNEIIKIDKRVSGFTHKLIFF